MRPRLLCASAIILTFAASGASGQSFDYAGLEALYGEPVTLSASGTPLRASDAPTNLTIITAEDIRRSGARDVADILDTVAGVSVVRTVAGAPEVAIRGYNRGFARDILVLINGREVFNSFYPNVQWGALPVALAEIRQIEVVRGVASALYGFNAASGVINIITKNPLVESGGAVSLRAGNGDFLDGELVTSHRLNDTVGLSLSAGARRQDAFGDRDLDARLLQTLEDDDGGFAALRIDARPSTDLRLDGALSVSRTTQSNYYPTNTLAKNDFVSVDAAAGFSWDLDGLLWSARTQYRRTLSDQSIPSTLGPADLFELENDFFTVNTELQASVPGGDSARFAAEYRRSELPPVDTGLESLNDTVTFDGFSLSANYDVRRLARLWANFSVRVDVGLVRRDGAPLIPDQDGERTFARPSANIGLNARPTDVDIIRLWLGYGHVLPSVAEFGAFQTRPLITPGAVAVAGTADLDPSRVFHAELAYERDIANGAANVRLSGYFKHFSDVIDVAPSAFVGFVAPERAPDDLSSPLFVFRNVGDSRAFGFESEIAAPLRDWLDFDVNYAFIDIDDDLAGPILPDPVTGAPTTLPRTVTDPATGEERPSFTTAFFEGGSARHEVNARLIADHGPWTARLSASYFGDYRLVRTVQLGADRFIAIDDRFELGGRIAYRLPFGLEFSLQVNNALRARFREGSLQEAERRWFAGATYRW